MQAVFSKFGTWRKDAPAAAGDQPTTPRSASPQRTESPSLGERAPESADVLRQSTVDTRVQLMATKALDPSSVQWVMKDGRIDKIGHGQYPIFKATVTILGKSKVVAVKGFDQEDKEDFEREVAVQSKMRHPCLLTLIGWCEKDGMHCLVMPYKKGGDLRHMIHDPAIPLPLVVLIPIFEDVLRGLRFLHGRNILHRDLKPENILLNKSRTHAKISDFGTTRQSANAMTVFAVGTVEYCAPEVFHSAEYDSAVDIFSLGVMYALATFIADACSIWECLTRVKPWSELKPPLALKVEKKLSAGERPIIPDGVPVPLRDLITRCWTFKPAERPSAEELLLRSFAKIKEQLCPELIAKQQTRPQLGIERGRSSGQSLEGSGLNFSLSQSRVIGGSTDRNSDDNRRIEGSWIRRSPKPTPSPSPNPVPPVSTYTPAAAEPPRQAATLSRRSATTAEPQVEKPSASSLPDSKLPLD